jgi:glycosyltransferase involved in cell wall biosynthesis
MNPLGGSELAYNELLSRMSDHHKEKINVILSNCHKELIDPKKINVLWQQLSYDQENVQQMNDVEFVNKIDAFVFVSHWQYEKFKKVFNVPGHKSVVIHNATNRFLPHKKSNNQKLKLIYTSMPNRGLELLIDSFEKLNRDDVEVDVYSSTIIYGSAYHRMHKDKYLGLFDRMLKVPNMYQKGYATNQEIRSALLNSHIMAYPSTFEETSCMSAIEALAAGCKLVSTNLGALPETGNIWADSMTFDNDYKKSAIRFSKLLNNAIDTYWDEDVQEKLTEQMAFYNKYYSWDFRIIQWQKLFNRILEIRYGK